VVNTIPWSLYPRERSPVPTVTKSRATRTEILSGLPEEYAGGGRKKGKRWQLKKRREQEIIFWNCKGMKSFQSHRCWKCHP